MFYVITCKNTMNIENSGRIYLETIQYVVDPSENEHVERFLAGTDDPMYDFVHELKFSNHPILPVSPILKEAEERNKQFFLK